MAMRPSIKAGDIPLGDIIGLIPAEGWVAVYSPNESKPLLFWVLLKSGELVGLVGSGLSIDTELRAADKVLNFSAYRKG